MSAAVMQERLDLAGRQRMLIQRFVKSACFVISGIQMDRFAAETMRDKTVFDKTLRQLIEGAPERGWSPEPNEDIRTALLAVLESWNVLRPAGLQIAHKDLAGIAVRQLIYLPDVTVGQMNQSVDLMALSMGRSGADPRLAETINVAGRQRMLSQRIAKELCFVVNDVYADQNRDRLRESIRVFGDSLEGLQAASPAGGDLFPASRKGLQMLAKGQRTWDALEPLLNRVVIGGSLGRDELEQVSDLSDELLGDMIAVVKTYVEAG